MSIREIRRYTDHETGHLIEAHEDPIGIEAPLFRGLAIQVPVLNSQGNQVHREKVPMVFPPTYFDVPGASIEEAFENLEEVGQAFASGLQNEWLEKHGKPKIQIAGASALDLNGRFRR